MKYSSGAAADAVDLSAWSVAARVRAGIRYVPERSDVFPGMSVEENVELASLAVGRPWTKSMLEQEIGALFPALIERRHAPAETLCGGQRRMLSLSMALVQEPRLLLIDEPFAGLAPMVVDDLTASLRLISRRGIGVAVIDHNITAILALADRIVLLKLGEVVFDRPREAVQESMILEAFA